MDEDQILQSIIADPKLTDPSIDVGQLRQTTPTRTELLADVPEFSGLKFDPTQRSYLEDLYTLYGGGLPMLPVEDTAQIPGAIDTLVDVGGGGGGGSLLDTPTAQIPGAVDTLINVGGEADMGTVPATTPVDNRIQIENISADPYSIGRDIDDPGASIENLTALQTPSSITRDIKPIQDLPMAQEPLDIPTQDVGLAYTGEFDPDDEGTVFDTSGLADATPEQRNTIQNILTAAGDNVQGALTELSKIPGAIVDFANQTVDIFGQKLNVGKTLASAVINKLAGGPISLVFDAIGALASNLPPGISETTNKAREVGLLVGDSTVTQDKYGINTQSAFGDYNQYNLDRVEVLEDKTNKTPRDIQELEERKNYIEKTGAAGDITPDATPLDIATGNVTGDATVAETIAQNQNIVDEVALTGGGGADRDPAPASTFTPRGGGADRDPAPSRGPVSTAGQAGPPSQRGGGGGGGGGGGKIVCTMMNESYGFGSFRNKIWIKYAKDNLSPEHQIGYHKIFLPLVRLSKTNKVLKKILEHIAVHRTIDIRQESRGKVHLLGRVYRKILEPICYFVGKHG